MPASSLRVLRRPWELIYYRFSLPVGKKVEHWVGLYRDEHLMTFNNHIVLYKQIVNVWTHALIDEAQCFFFFIEKYAFVW